MTAVGRIASGAWVVVCLFALSLPAVAAATISLTPDKGPVGTTVAVQGSGFESKEVALQWDASGSSTRVTANGSGSLLSDTLGSLAQKGTHEIVAAAASGTGRGRFVITGQPSPSLTTATTAPPTTTTTAAPTKTTTDRRPPGRTDHYLPARDNHLPTGERHQHGSARLHSSLVHHGGPTRYIDRHHCRSRGD